MITRLDRVPIPWVIAGMLALGLAIRLAVLGLPGHTGDVTLMARWAEAMARYGPGQFYQHDDAIYPALLYVFWPLGLLFDGAWLDHVLKAFSIPFDLAMAVVLYRITASTDQPRRALIAPALYLFNPAVILAGPIWGQVDAVGTLAMLLALLAVSSGRFVAAGALVALAALIKPHSGIVALVVLAVAFYRWRRSGQIAPVLKVAGAGIASFALLTIPLGLGPLDWISRISDLSALNPLASLNAPNLWGVLVGYQQPDAGLFWVGAVLLLLGFAATLVWLGDRQNLATVLTAGVLLVFAFYFLPTRVHERYLFPAMALLAPLAVSNVRVLIGYLLLSAAFALAMLCALVSTTPFTLPEPWEGLLLQRATSVYVGLTMLATAATLVFLLSRRSALPSRA